MRYSFKIASAWGIPIELHITFILLIAAVLILSIPTQQFYTFFIVLFLFVFVVFHELAHSVVARHYGIKVRKIVLYPIGGVSEIEEIPDNPSQEWRMAIAGPLTSLVFGVTLLAVSLFALTPSIHHLYFHNHHRQLSLRPRNPKHTPRRLQPDPSFPNGRRQSL